MLGTWGPVTFQASADKVRTWQGMRRSGEARWHKHEVHLGKPRPEFLGPGDDTIQLEVRLDSQLGLVPNDELESLRRERDAGKWHPLIIGGEFVFDCFLRVISEEHRRHAADGTLLLAIVELTLEEYQ